MEKFKLTLIGADEDVPRMLLAFGKGCGGEVALVMRPRENTALLVHQVKKEPAKVWRTDLGRAPSHAPELAVAPNDALAELRKLKSSPPPAGPATLRGTWTGALHCVDGTPSVTLERKVASYGVLRLASKSDGRWAATFDRSEKWFSKAKSDHVERSSLADAIQAGMGLVIGLVSEACSFRDTHRRNTVDADYAAQHPPAPRRERKDPTERFKPPAAPVYSLRGDAAGFDVLDLAGNVVARFGAREKGRAEKHLRALNAGKVTDAPPKTDPVFTDPAADRAARDREVPSLDAVREPQPPSCPMSVANIASGLSKEAQALTELSDSLWGSTEAPDLLNRAAKLIKRAHALVSSPLCSGKEQKAAFEDINRAASAYQQAWDAIGRGEKPDIVTTLRRISERVSLAAARAAKSCAAGQQKLGAPTRTANDVASGIGRREAGWNEGDRVTWRGQVWVVRDVRGDGSVDVMREGTDLAETVAASELRRAPGNVTMLPTRAAPARPPAPAADKPARTRKPRADAVDPEKDKALMAAFADAIKTAAVQMGGS